MGGRIERRKTEGPRLSRAFAIAGAEIDGGCTFGARRSPLPPPGMCSPDQLLAQRFVNHQPTAPRRSLARGLAWQHRDGSSVHVSDEHLNNYKYTRSCDVGKHAFRAVAPVQ